MKRFALLLVFLIGTYAYAQDSRGSITGQVTDPAGAVIPHAKVTITSTDTGAITRATTTDEGYYTVPGLQPGGYTVTVDAAEFKSFERTGIHLETQQNATINVKLIIGARSEVISVNADAPLITTADASTGQVLTTEEVQDLPSNGGSPLGFARLEYGVVTKAKHAISNSQPMSNSTVDDFSLGGSNASSNELLLNGVPNMQDASRTAGFSPQLDSVNEVRVDVFGANVTYGDSSGGTVNISTKSGTNQFHGSASAHYQDQGCSSLDGNYASRSANHCSWMSALPYSTTVGNASPTSTHFNQIGASIGGPVWLPRVYNGHNKLFFFYAYERFVGEQPAATTIGTVPTAAERTGDFSALLALGSAYQLYNPTTAVGTQTNYTRTAIPGNIFANAGLMVSPIAQAYMKYVPLPNYTGATTTAAGENNYFTFTPTTQDYRSHMGRIDYNISDNDKIFGEAHRSRILNQASNYFHDALTGTNTDTIMFGSMLEEVHTFTQTLFLDTRASLTRYDNGNLISSNGISPTSLGLPGYIATNSTALAIPYITFSDVTSSPLAYSNKLGSFENFDTLQLFSTATKIFKSHTILAGFDLRAKKESWLNPTYPNGTFSFGHGKANPVTAGSSATPSAFGDSYALFMLGIPTGGSETINPPYQYNSFLNAFFVQDDWKARPNVTVSVGVRLEHEIPLNESQNRMVIGFDPNATNEVTTQAEASYAAHPSSLLPAASFLPTGGAIFASSDKRNALNMAPLYVSPRLGITWAPSALKQKGVLRAGYGIYVNPFNEYNQGQNYGFSGSTTYVQSSDGGMHNGSISDPFPTATNPIQLPTGNSLGVNQNLGAGMVFYPSSLKVAYSERASLDFQYQIGNTILIDLGYVNNHQVHMSYSNNVSAIPLLPYLSRSQYYDYGVTNKLTGTTPKVPTTPSTSIVNPFLGLPGITGSYATATLMAPNAFLQTYPEFSSVTEQLVPGASAKYNALNARVAKRMGHGLTLNGVFEWSRLLGTFNQLNQGDALNYGETTSDYPFHLAAYGTYQLPFGHGREFFSKNRILDPIIGGWQISAVYQFSSGQPIQWNNAIYTGSGFKDLNNVQHSRANRNGTPVFNTAVFDTRVCTSSATACNDDPTNVTVAKPYNPTIQPNSYNYRTFPQYLMRQDYTSNWDGNVQKDFTTYKGIKVELRMDAFNLLNRPEYNSPTVSPVSANFGKTSGVASGTTARQLQVGGHIIF